MYKRFLQPNEKLNESTNGNGAAPQALIKLLSTNIASGQEISGSNSAEKKNSCNMATDKEKDGTTSNSSPGKRKRNDAEQPSEGKATNTSGCFQSNHWAVAFPSASSRTRHQAEYGDSQVRESSPCKILLNPRNEDDAKRSDGNDSQLQAADAPTVRNGKLHEASASGKMNMNMKPCERDTASSSGEKKLKENQVMPLSNFINSQIAVKRLRLSRTIILKWMNSHSPPSHLDGFFLRLRLGKWEQGLGGTGYYVACITGGVKCLVQSQYISNHDFTEGELMAWWCATLKDGGKTPSEEELRLKVEELKMLRF
ncbi:hypothetical protein NC652_021722 [Populus alba x Populus x berolinensis]|nr:hypothetical protein NC652_021722 [Populus alba x Populus x berolinensis]